MKTLLLLLGSSLLSTFAFSQANNHQEIVQKRTEFSKTYLKEDGSYENVISMVPVHYLKEGSWETIDTKIKYTTKGYENLTNSLQVKFPGSLSNQSSIEISAGNNLISIEKQKKYSWFDASGTILSTLALGDAELPSIDENRISFGSTGNIIDHFEVLPAQLKNDIELQIKPLNSSNASYFGATETLHLKDGWSIVSQNGNSTGLIEGGLVILDEKNEVIFKIPEPFIYEKNAQIVDGSSSITGKYKVSKNDNSWEITTLVSADWLNENQRSYPVIIDPTVVLPGADGGWMSAVNLVNNPAFVFIGVCCGNQEHRAWLNFNTTSINDNSCVTAVELEVYVNGVGNAATELVHAYDMTYLPGPYPAIDPLVLYDMETGWYTSFTLSGVGTYGYYNLGTWANSVLQSQLPINWYQVALIFDNEPSTNWKRLTAGSCNLRVTYLDPPCTVLPIELTDFEVTCNGAQTEFNWTTASELDNNYFTVWRSTNNLQFEPIHQVKSQGNSQSTQNYQWKSDRKDDEVTYYRLSQTDIDGETTFFNTETIYPCLPETIVSLDELNNLVVIGDGIISIQILDVSGKAIFTSTSVNGKQLFDLNSISSGVYSVAIYHESGERTTHSIVIP